MTTTFGAETYTRNPAGDVHLKPVPGSPKAKPAPFTPGKFADDLFRATKSERATREVEADPVEVAELRAARDRLDRGEGHWVPDDVSVEDDLLTD